MCEFHTSKSGTYAIHETDQQKNQKIHCDGASAGIRPKGRHRRYSDDALILSEGTYKTDPHVRIRRIRDLVISFGPGSRAK